jgi:sugar lactone lactonase YvrE
VAPDGRIWIGKSTAAKKIPSKIAASCFSQATGSKSFSVTYEEPPAYVAFQADGTLLGEVRFPLRARVTFVGNTAWALVPDADDVPTLIKYRLHN